MSDRGANRRHRADPLSPSEQSDLEALDSKPFGREKLSIYFEVVPESVRRWIRGQKFEKWRRERLLALLTGEVAWESLPTTRAMEAHLLDPRAEMEQSFQSAEKAHYNLYDPVSANDWLVRFLGHPRFLQMQPEWLIGCLVKSLSILRQSMGAGEAIVCLIAQRCLERLASLSPVDKRESLAARVCALAWEIAALVTLRGGSVEALPLMDSVDSVIERLRLADALPAGRAFSIAKMRYWALNVGHPDLCIARRDVLEKDGSIRRLEQMTIEEKLRIKKPVEILNLKFLELAALLRLTLAAERRAGKSLEHFVDGDFLPRFYDLTRKVDRQGIQSLSQVITPGTGKGIALFSSILAAHLSRSDSEQVLSCAGRLYDAIDEASHGFVALQSINRQTVAAVGDLRRSRWASVVPSFHAVADLNGRMKRVLLTYAERILAQVEHCL